MDAMTIEEFNQSLARLDEKEREYLKILITQVVKCYTSNHTEGVLITGDRDNAKISVLLINGDEMSTTGLLDAATTFFAMKNTADAPPREMFN